MILGESGNAVMVRKKKKKNMGKKSKNKSINQFKISIKNNQNDLIVLISGEPGNAVTASKKKNPSKIQSKTIRLF